MAMPIEWMGNGHPLPADQYPPTHPFANDVAEVLDDPSNVLPVLSSPPSYSTVDAAARQQQQQQQAALGHAAVSSLPLTRGYNVVHAKPHAGLYVHALNSSSNLCYIGRYFAVGAPDLVLYEGENAQGRALGKAKLFAPDASKNMQIAIRASEGVPVWETVSCVVQGKVWHSDSWHFSIAQGTKKARSLCWKPTHDANLGSGKFRSKDYKLLDGREVVAVYLDSTTDNNGTVGRVECRGPALSGDAALVSLVVLMAIRERVRRHVQQSGRAVVNQAHQFPPLKGVRI